MSYEYENPADLFNDVSRLIRHNPERAIVFAGVDEEGAVQTSLQRDLPDDLSEITLPTWQMMDFGALATALDYVDATDCHILVYAGGLVEGALVAALAKVVCNGNGVPPTNVFFTDGETIWDFDRTDVKEGWPWTDRKDYGPMSEEYAFLNSEPRKDCQWDWNTAGRKLHELNSVEKSALFVKYLSHGVEGPLDASIFARMLSTKEGAKNFIKSLLHEEVEEKYELMFEVLDSTPVEDRVQIFLLIGIMAWHLGRGEVVSETLKKLTDHKEEPLYKLLYGAAVLPPTYSLWTELVAEYLAS